MQVELLCQVCPVGLPPLEPTAAPLMHKGGRHFCTCHRCSSRISSLPFPHSITHCASVGLLLSRCGQCGTVAVAYVVGAGLPHGVKLRREADASIIVKYHHSSGSSIYKFSERLAVAETTVRCDLQHRKRGITSRSLTVWQSIIPISSRSSEYTRDFECTVFQKKKEH